MSTGYGPDLLLGAVYVAAGLVLSPTRVGKGLLFAGLVLLTSAYIGKRL